MVPRISTSSRRHLGHRVSVREGCTINYPGGCCFALVVAVWKLAQQGIL